MKKLCLNIFIDAFGWELLSRYSFLDDILLTKKPLGTVFGYSSTCDPTILTGKMPNDHEHFSFFYHNPTSSPFKWIKILDLFPKSIMNRGRVRHHISKTIKRFYGYTGYFQLYNMPFNLLHFFDYSEKRDLYEKGGINSGASTVFDFLRDNQIEYYLSDWRKNESFNLAGISDCLRNREVAFAYLYLAAMDADLHRYGPRSSKIEEKINWYDDKIRNILSLANDRYDQVILSIFSDHGMTEVTDLCDLMAQINTLNLKFGSDYSAVYDSTMARFWFFNPPARDRILNLLSKVEKGIVLSDKTLEDYGCNFKNNIYGEKFFLMKPGILLCPSFMGEKPMMGMHGYDPYHKDSIAMFASNYIPENNPKRLDDLYQLMIDPLQN